MPRTATSNVQSAARPRRRRRRRSEPFGLVPGGQTATQTDEAAEARALFADLLALLDAGLVAPQHGGRTVRYAAVDEARQAGGHGIA